MKFVSNYFPGVQFVLLACFWFLLAGTALARVKPKPDSVDRDYLPALAAADRFLHAWQVQDQEGGLLMLTDQAKKRSSEQRLDEFFSPGDLAAYQIGAGKKLKAGCYTFPVALLS